MNNQQRYERYQRQIILKEFGAAAQKKLFQAKVLVIGVGGLGCPALQYLVAAGVGTIGIIDDDVVSLTNLHRQVLYSTDDIGFPKVEIAAKQLKRLNEQIQINTYQLRLTNTNALTIIEQFDLVIDGTDNFSSRYLINDVCVLLKKPLIYGAVSRFEGQVAVFNSQHSKKRTVNYRDIFPTPPKDDEILNCAEAGVLGVVPGIIGTMQANEAIKLITGIGECLINKMLTYNALTNQTYELDLSLNETSQQLIPKSKEEFLKMNYEWHCNISERIKIIDAEKFKELLQTNEAVVIDVREENELPNVSFEHIKIPLSHFEERIDNIEKHKVVLFCQTGKRSLKAAEILLNHFQNEKEIYSLKDGIAGLK